MATFWTYLKLFDYPALHYLNVTLASPLTDQFWGTITHLHKIPLVRIALLPLVLVLFCLRVRAQAWKPLSVLVAAVGLTDLFCYRVVKQLVQRPRPFENPEISAWVRKVGEAHGASFPSNHAANCFAAAVVLSIYFPRRWPWFYGFAGLVAWSRPSLGVHYPSDVIAGAAFGVIIALLVTSTLFAFLPSLWMSEPETEQSGDWRRRFDRHRRG